MHDTIAQQIKDAPVVLYMKGTREYPMCGFSAKVVAILDHYLDTYVTYNVLEDDELRNGIKTFSDWPTIPQLYVNEEFVGGCDIVTELHNNGELKELLS